MKKRILALALAGTTAFSVFGALNVSAATHKVDETEVYTAYEIYDLTTSGNSIAAAKAAGGSFETIVDFDEAMETPVENGDVYLYDFFEVFSDEGYEVEDFEDEDKTPDDVIAEYGGLTGGYNGDYEFGDGDKRSFREDLIEAWDEFIDEISLVPGDYDVEEGDPYKFNDLLGDIKDVVEYKDNTFKGASAFISSELVYLMQEYARFIDSEYATLVEVDDDAWVDLLVEVLEARAEEDFTTTKAYRAWTADLEDLIEEYEDAETRTELTTIRTKLETLVKMDDVDGIDAGTPEKADLTDLAAALADTITIGEGADKETWQMYPVQDFTKSNGKLTDEYAWADRVYKLADTVNGKGKRNNFQGSVDVLAEALTEALDALVPATEPKASRLLSLEEWVDTYSGLNEIDYAPKAWGWYTKALDRAEDLLAGDPGKKQVADAVEMLDLAAKIMKDCEYHVAPKKSQVRELDAAIKEATEWLKEYDDTAAVSKVLAVTKALANAEAVKKDYNDDKCVLLSKILGATEAIETALTSPAVANGWLKTADGWMYGTENGYVTGWAKIGAVYYFFDADGIANESEWMYENGKWYYFTSGCNAVANHWALVDGKWYWFNEDYSMFANGWKWINNKCYYFYADGSMAANTTIDGYVVGADGAWIA